MRPYAAASRTISMKIRRCNVLLLLLSAILSIPPAYCSLRGGPDAGDDLLNRIQDSIPIDKSDKTEYGHFFVYLEDRSMPIFKSERAKSGPFSLYLEDRPPVIKARSTSIRFSGGGPGIESIFDCIAAILTSAPIADVDAAGPMGLSVNILDNKSHKTKSEIRNLNSEIRNDFLKTHPNLDGSAFLFNGLPVDVLHRYPGVMTKDEVCNTQNIRWIPKSIFGITSITFEDAQKEPSWKTYFEELAPGANRQNAFNHENLTRQGNRIIENSRFRALCNEWETFFRTHESVTQSQLLQEQSYVDNEFSDILHK